MPAYDDRAPRDTVERAKQNYSHLSTDVLRQIAKHNRAKSSSLEWNVDRERTVTATAVACEELIAERSA